MHSRELKCFNKILMVCKNRGFSDLADDILKSFGPKYLSKTEVKEASIELPKAVKYENKITFLENAAYIKDCTKCMKKIEIGEPIFLHGRHLYHAPCGAETLADGATDNFFYKRWIAKTERTDYDEAENQ